MHVNDFQSPQWNNLSDKVLCLQIPWQWRRMYRRSVTNEGAVNWTVN
jgi:hypothetical protein